MMTEEEKALTGQAFNGLDPELLIIKRKAHLLSHQYSQITEENVVQRAVILNQLLAEVGDNANFQGPIFFNYGVHTKIGNNFFANYNLTVLDDAEVVIGNQVLIGPNCTLATPRHPLVADDRVTHVMDDGKPRRFCKAEPILIEDGVWLASNVTVVGGVTIGKNSVIGAGSVVTHDIPRNCLAAGVPCRVIRQVTKEKHWLELD